MKTDKLQIENIVDSKDMANVHLIVEKYHPLIVSSINRYYNKPHEFEELYDEGVLEVCEALMDYDVNKNDSFGGYLKSRLYFFYISKNKFKENLSLDSPIGEEDLTLMDMLMDPMNIENEYEINEEYKILYKAIGELTERQRRVLLDFYIGRFSISDIAKKYDIKYRTVVNTKTMALKKLKKYLLSSKISKF